VDSVAVDGGDEDDRDVAAARVLLDVAAVSKPFMSAICTSSRMRANSRCRISRNASSPDRAITSSWPSGARIASRATRFAG
jgi:hypothetical protein